MLFPVLDAIGVHAGGRFKQWRDLATRYAKRAAIYRASLVIAATMIWLNDPQEKP